MYTLHLLHTYQVQVHITFIAHIPCTSTHYICRQHCGERYLKRRNIEKQKKVYPESRFGGDRLEVKEAKEVKQTG